MNDNDFYFLTINLIINIIWAILLVNFLFMRKFLMRIDYKKMLLHPKKLIKLLKNNFNADYIPSEMNFKFVKNNKIINVEVLNNLDLIICIYKNGHVQIIPSDNARNFTETILASILINLDLNHSNVLYDLVGSFYIKESVDVIVNKLKTIDKHYKNIEESFENKIKDIILSVDQNYNADIKVDLVFSIFIINLKNIKLVYRFFLFFELNKTIVKIKNGKFDEIYTEDIVNIGEISEEVVININIEDILKPYCC